MTLAVIQAVVRCRRLGESLRSGHGNVSRHLISSTSWLPAVKCLKWAACESEFCVCRSVCGGGWLDEVTGGGRTRERGAGAGASGDVRARGQGLTMVYRVSRRRASGNGARAGRLMEWSVRWRRCLGRRSGMVHGGVGCARGGRTKARAVGRPLARDERESTSLIHARRDSAVRELVGGRVRKLFTGTG